MDHVVVRVEQGILDPPDAQFARRAEELEDMLGLTPAGHGLGDGLLAEDHAARVQYGELDTSGLSGGAVGDGERHRHTFAGAELRQGVVGTHGPAQQVAQQPHAIGRGLVVGTTPVVVEGGGDDIPPSVSPL